MYRDQLEIWEFPDLIEREKGADRLGVRDADKTKKKKKEEAREIVYLATAANINSYGYWISVPRLFGYS